MTPKADARAPERNWWAPLAAIAAVVSCLVVLFSAVRTTEHTFVTERRYDADRAIEREQRENVQAALKEMRSVQESMRTTIDEIRAELYRSNGRRP